MVMGIVDPREDNWIGPFVATTVRSCAAIGFGDPENNIAQKRRAMGN